MRNHRPFYHIKNHNHIKALSFNHGTPILQCFSAGNPGPLGPLGLIIPKMLDGFSQQEIMVDVGEITYLGS